jgi:adenylylsulfate kinase
MNGPGLDLAISGSHKKSFKTRNHTIQHNYLITPALRSPINLHRSLVSWFRGLSGSDKSTIANEVGKALFEEEVHTYLLDGDNIRSGLNMDLFFITE